MRKSVALLLGLAFVLSGSFGQERDYYDYSFARLNHVQGDVIVQRTEGLGQEAGVVNLVLVTGDKLGTRGGRAEVHFGRRNFLRLDNYTEVEFAGLPRSGYDQVRLNLLEGEIFLRVDTMQQDFELHTPDASFYILDIGLYRWRVDKHGQTEVEVVEGEVEAAAEDRSEVVKTGEQLRASQGRIVYGPARTYARYSSSFYEWNRGREAYHNRSYASSYLPEELYEYESELDNNGRWVYEQPYGYVWIPHVYHNTWRPYCNGRWLWYPICGWTWISYDPWGWCVHHYGRWQWRFGLGWYWIPTCHWGPAWVSWYHGVNHYGWCPLSYHGYPGVIINNHYYGDSYHYYNSYPVNSRAMVIVNKNQLQDRNISRAALSPGKVRNLNQVSLSKSQPAVRPASRAASYRSADTRITSRSNTRSLSSRYSSRSSALSRVRTDSSRSSGSSPSRLGSSRSGDRTYASRQSTSSRETRSSSARSSAAVQRYPSSRTSLRGSVSRAEPSGTVRRFPSRSSTSRSSSLNRSSALGSRFSGRSGSSRSSAGISSRSSSSRSSSSGRSSSSRVYPSSRSPASRSYSSSRSSSSRSPSGNRASSLSSRSSSRSSSSRSSSGVSSRGSSSSSRSSSASRTRSSSRSSAGRSSSSRSSSSSRVKKK